MVTRLGTQMYSINTLGVCQTEHGLPMMVCTSTLGLMEIRPEVVIWKCALTWERMGVKQGADRANLPVNYVMIRKFNEINIFYFTDHFLL